MAKHKGPVDDDILKVAQLIIRHRGQRWGDLCPADRNAFDEALNKVHDFAMKIGPFATRKSGVAEYVFDDIIAGFRWTVGKQGFIRNAGQILNVFFKGWSLGVTISGRFFFEFRAAVRRIEQSGATNHLPDTVPKLESELAELLFDNPEEMGDEEFPKAKKMLLNTHCYGARKGVASPKTRFEIGLCGQGCDVLLLKRLNFHVETIAELLKLTRTTTDNWISACEGTQIEVRKRS